MFGCKKLRNRATISQYIPAFSSSAGDNKPFRILIMKTKTEFSPTVFLLSACQFLGAFNFLIILWLKGTTIPEPVASRAIPIFLTFSVIALFTGSLELLMGIRKHDPWLTSKALGLLVASLVLFDLWLSHGSIRFRDILLLAVSGLAAVPMLGAQIVAFRSGKKQKMRNEQNEGDKLEHPRIPSPCRPRLS